MRAGDGAPIAAFHAELGPDPTTATFFHVRVVGSCGVTHPSAYARSMIETSMSLMVTGSSLIPSTHDPSQGAGHSRPVNSGKLFVAWRRSIAARHLSL